jgi:subtilase family serine protease
MKPPNLPGSRRMTGYLATAAGSALLLGGLAAPAIGATGGGQPSTMHVPQGVGANALSGLTVFGPTPPSTPETVSFILKARNLGDLKANVLAGMPGGYLSVSQFARNYGQPQDNISALENYLSGYGIAATADADGLDVTATGTAGQFDSALGVQQQQFKIPATRSVAGNRGHAARIIHGTTQQPLLPRDLGRFVLSVLGLVNYPTFSSLAVHRPALVNSARPAAVQTGSLTPSDFASQYNLSPLYSKGATGAGQTIGIVTLASLNPADPEFFWNNVLGISTPANRITLDNVDGGAGPVSDAAGSGETSLDVEQSGALAPQAKIVVYQAPNTDFGFVDGFYTAASQNIADTVSASWGSSETIIQASVNSGTESPTYAIAFDDAFLEMAAQGQSAFISAGDFGAYTPAEDLGTTNLGAGNPDSSPWITTAGGTTLPGTIPLTATDSATISSERTWGWDWLWPHFADFGAPSESAFAFANPIGGGGGYSVLEPTAGYQEGVRGVHHFSAVQYLQPTTFKTIDGLFLPTAWNLNPAPTVTTGFGTGRATPDISADADPFTGYLLYFSEFPSGQPALQAGWGGTSFVAPQLNGSAALIDSFLGHRTGFWNPAAYALAQGSHSPFTPLDAASANNDNLYYTGTAGNIFNVGSGLGTPNLALLARELGR